jgi:A/G-specific adenine glycosylase
MEASRGQNSAPFRRALLGWFTRHRRDLPWRRTPDPYRIWVSEIMLQQTRAAAAIPYYERFLKRFPNVEALARAPEAALLECWSGLGYYSRARNLRLAAQQIVHERSGRWPESSREWEKLPGVGPYTAAAVASIAFGEKSAVLDGNVARVMARLTNHSGDIRSPRVRQELRERAQEFLDPRQPGEFNQGAMELGATLCLPRRPQCGECPVARWCEARRLGTENELPVKLARRAAVEVRLEVAVVERGEKPAQVLMQQRGNHLSLMPGFWELPEAGALWLTRREPVGEFHHAITHHDYTVTVVRGRLRGGAPEHCEWISKDQLGRLPLATITRKALLLAAGAEAEATVRRGAAAKRSRLRKPS